jgi:hypothetical protein
MKIWKTLLCVAVLLAASAAATAYAQSSSPRQIFLAGTTLMRSGSAAGGGLWSRSESRRLPLGQCLNDSTLATPFGVGCWRPFGFSKKPPGNEVESLVYTSVSTVQTVVLTDGKLWSALNTTLDFGNRTQVGIAYFILQPQISSGGVGGGVLTQGYLGLANNNLTYPSIGVTAKGRGVISFTLVPDRRSG